MSVQVYVYDLSNGLAAVFAPMVIGAPLEAVFHTSVVVFGKEYYIDQGIKCAAPGTTKYGVPREVLERGTTEVPEDVFEDFLEELRTHEAGKYSAAAYDLFDNNCNHFSDVVLDFLVGRGLDERILTLPQQVLALPNGRALRQMLSRGQPW